MEPLRSHKKNGAFRPIFIPWSVVLSQRLRDFAYFGADANFGIDLPFICGAAPIDGAGEIHSDTKRASIREVAIDRRHIN
jgi:hypothetical protein